MNITYKVSGRTFATLEAASEYAHRIWRNRGSIVAVEEVKKRRPPLDAYAMEQDRLKQASNGAHE